MLLGMILIQGVCKRLLGDDGDTTLEDKGLKFACNCMMKQKEKL